MCKQEKYVNLQTGDELDWIKVSRLKDNTMLKVKPELWVEWDFEKNEELDLEIYKLTKGSNKKVWWLCHKCGSNYDMSIFNRSYGRNCSYCRGLRVNHTNSLASLRPDLVKEWHPTKNGTLTPHDVTCGSNKKAWWKCDLGHEWGVIINERSSGKGCPYCSGRSTLIGFSDMWTTNPELASMLANPEDGYNHTYGSDKKVDWKCPDCGEIIKNKRINNIYYKGLHCPKCSDGFSYPEKVMYHLLKELKIKFEYQKTFDWSKGKRYDFYLNDTNLIIETHGKQHYIGGFEFAGGNSLEEEQENDNLKETLAKKNNITNYIVIDSRESTVEYIKNNIINSELSNIYNLTNIDWLKIGNEALGSMMINVCKMWQEKEDVSTLEIANLTKLSQLTVIKYLKLGSEIKICDYNRNTSYKNASEKRKMKVIQLDNNLNYIREWNSIKEACEHLDLKSSGGIIKSCKDLKYSARGYKWMYEEEYKKYIEAQKKIS